MLRRPATRIELRLEDDIEEHDEFRARLKAEGASYLRQLREEHGLPPTNDERRSTRSLMALYQLDNLAEFLEITASPPADVFKRP